MQNIHKEIAKYKWKQMWAGDWYMLNVSDWGEYYITDVDINKVAFLISDKKISAWAEVSCIENFSKEMVKRYATDKQSIINLGLELKKYTDITLNHIDNTIKHISFEDYYQSMQNIRAYYTPHIAVKYMVDYLSPEKLEEYLPILEDARVYAEPVFTRTLVYDRELAKQISNSAGVDPEYLPYMTKQELKKYFISGELPSLKILEARAKRSALVFFDNKKPYLFLDEEADQIISAVSKVEDNGELKGKTAYPGKVQGRVKIILDPSKPGDFAEGDILVTSMTRPEYLQLIKKSGAVVTEAGGILSHAAITTRELKKPCVIGTMVATKVLKDGDMVEVDADNGIINIIK